MTTLMLVDDERPARELLKLAIDWEKADCKIISEACNGQQAFEAYQKEKPDLIITDIQMPLMDGLELIEKITALDPTQKIVILSCHESFSYAKKAFSMGVMDYLIKDAFTQEELCGILSRISAKKTVADRISAPSAHAAAVDGILMQNAKSRKLPPHFSYFCAAAKIEHYTADSSQWNHVLAELRMNFPRESAIDYTFGANSVLLLLCLLEPSNSKMNQFNTRFQYLQCIRQTLSQATGCTVSLGVSDVWAMPERIDLSLQEAVQALDSKVFYGKGKIIYHNPEHSRHESFQIESLKNTFSRIQKAISSSNERLLHQELLELYNKNYQGVLHYNYLNYINAILLDILSQSCIDLKLPYTKIFGSDAIPLELFETFDSVDDMLHWFQEHFRLLFQNAGSDENGCSPRIRQIICYLQEHYQEDISLETIAEIFWLHKVYLAKIFKKETGKSVNEYIRFLRIEKAKQLLTEENAKVNDIASQTGFNNPQSFYTIFKRSTNMSPGEYREKHLK